MFILKPRSNLKTSLCLAVTSTLSTGLATIVHAHGLPLQVGIYRLGSSYIQIAAEGERLCYQSFSTRGSLIGSITPDPQLEGFYQINGLEHIVLHQQDTQALLFGSVHELSTYEADYGSPEGIGITLQQCLDSNTPFLSEENGN